MTQFIFQQFWCQKQDPKEISNGTQEQAAARKSCPLGPLLSHHIWKLQVPELQFLRLKELSEFT